MLKTNTDNYVGGQNQQQKITSKNSKTKNSLEEYNEKSFMCMCVFKTHSMTRIYTHHNYVRYDRRKTAPG